MNTQVIALLGLKGAKIRSENLMARGRYAGWKNGRFQLFREDGHIINTNYPLRDSDDWEVVAYRSVKALPAEGTQAWAQEQAKQGNLIHHRNLPYTHYGRDEDGFYWAKDQTPLVRQHDTRMALLSQRAGYQAGWSIYTREPEGPADEESKFGLKVVREDFGSLTDEYGRHIYGLEWGKVAGRGAYVAIFGGLGFASYDYRDPTLRLIMVECRERLGSAERTVVCQRWRWVRRCEEINPSLLDAELIAAIKTETLSCHILSEKQRAMVLGPPEPEYIEMRILISHRQEMHCGLPECKYPGGGYESIFIDQLGRRPDYEDLVFELPGGKIVHTRDTAIWVAEDGEWMDNDPSQWELSHEGYNKLLPVRARFAVADNQGRG